MTVLTANEADVLEVVRYFALMYPEGVPTDSIRFRAFNRRGIRYDATQRALKGLAAKGHVHRPKRGYWLPGAAQEEAALIVPEAPREAPLTRPGRPAMELGDALEALRPGLKSEVPTEEEYEAFAIVEEALGLAFERPFSEDAYVRIGDVLDALRRRPATMNPPMPQPGPFRSAADFLEREHREGRLRRQEGPA
jgi:hypothetical protein